MREIITFILVFICLSGVKGQKFIKNIKNFEGIWIAEGFYKAFEKHKSSISTKDAFNPNYPVGLRINLREIKENKLNIGYSVLHDHLLYPEVSNHMVYNNDTIYEQGYFLLNIKQKDSLGFYKLSNSAYLYWDSIHNILSYRLLNSNKEELIIKYRKIDFKYSNKYQYPNPLYYYTRSRTLTGKYFLKNEKGDILSSNFQICMNGKVRGYQPFEGYTTYFSTDVYCGPPIDEDVVLFYENILDDNARAKAFGYKMNQLNEIELYNKNWLNDYDSYELNLKYILTKIELND